MQTGRPSRMPRKSDDVGDTAKALLSASTTLGGEGSNITSERASTSLLKPRIVAESIRTAERTGAAPGAQLLVAP